MKTGFLRILRLLLLLLVFGLSPAWARTTVQVPLDSRAYEQLDILRANGLIKSQIVGVRPYSRQEVARLIGEADAHLKLGKSQGKNRDFLLETLEDLKKSFSRELGDLQGKGEDEFVRVKAVEKATVEFTALNDDARSVPLNNNLGPITAKYQPLFFFKQGRDYVEGTLYSLSSRHWVEVSPYFNLAFSPRAQFQFPQNEALDQDQFFVDELQATVGVKNLRLSVGRTPLILGQSPYGGIILSSNTRAVDQIILTHDRPFKFPWFFEHLGYQKMVAYFGTLGPESFFKNTLLAGYKWSMKPLSAWEMSLSNVMTIGGEGAPAFGAWDFIGDYLGFSGTSNSVSNRILGFDTRVGIPQWRGLEIYAEAFWDDKTFESLKRTLIDTSAYKIGVFMPRVTDNGRLSARFEARYISELFYRHSQFQSGYTLNNEILGDPLGPDSLGFFLDLAYVFNPHTRFFGGLSYFTADSNVYSNVGTAIYLVTDNPKESHHQVSLGLEKSFKLCDVAGELRFDHVRNKGFFFGTANDVFFSVKVQKNWF